jgi:hypothetical protein
MPLEVEPYQATPFMPQKNIFDRPDRRGVPVRAFYFWIFADSHIILS